MTCLHVVRGCVKISDMSTSGTWLNQSKWHVYAWYVVVSKEVTCLQVVCGCVKESDMSTRDTWLCQSK